MFEFNCSKLIITDEKSMAQVEFKGRSELVFFILRRNFKENFIGVFNTEASFTGNEGFWTFITITLNEHEIIFSYDYSKIKIKLKINQVKRQQLIKCLERIVGYIGKSAQIDHKKSL